MKRNRMRIDHILPRFALALAIFLLLSGAAGAQTTLPQKLGAWTSPEVRVLVGAQIAAFAGEKSALLDEFGIVTIEERQYSRLNETLSVTLYRFRDTTGAYGALRFIAEPPRGILEMPQPPRRVLLMGHFVFEAKSNDKAALDSGVKLLLGVLEMVGDPTPYPTLADSLPEKERVPHSERFLLGNVGLKRVLPLLDGDWVGFGNGAEAIYARYEVGGRQVPLLVISYPTPQVAIQRERDLAQWFNVNGADPASKRKRVYARRDYSLLALTPETDAAIAGPLLAGVHLEQQLTVNEPGFRWNEKPIQFYIYSIFVGTGIILAFAGVAGLAFGGVRLVTKRYFPGKIFDRTEAVEIIQLGLTSKPISARDFY
jgi:hypothetical protein